MVNNAPIVSKPDKKEVKAKKPYRNKCYLPFILYPSAMYKNDKGHAFIEELNMDEIGGDFVLYIGIPFCRVRCKGCPYFVARLSKTDPRNEEDIFVDALIKDIKHWASYKKWNTGSLKAIYIGGGTGTILKTKNLKRIIDKIFECFNVSDEYCLTLEGNASDYDEEKLDYVANSEITRVSLGVQSFVPEVLKIVGSPHAAEESIKIIKALQSRGFDNIQMDLMFNMPGHSLEVWKQDLQTMVDLGIKHFTAYLYRIHDETPQAAAIKRGKVAPVKDPESPLVKAMRREAKEIAESFGFKMYMADHYAKPGYENKYNHWSWKVYTDALAIGPGGYSYFDRYRLGTEKNVDKYIERVNKGEFLISTISMKMDEQIEKERYVIFTLLYYCVEFEAYRARFGSEFLDDFKDIVEKLKRKELIDIDFDQIRLTQLGIEWHANVLLEFFNPMFWSDQEALKENNWSMNIPMVELAAKNRDYWLGEF